MNCRRAGWFSGGHATGARGRRRFRWQRRWCRRWMVCGTCSWRAAWMLTRHRRWRLRRIQGRGSAWMWARRRRRNARRFGTWRCTRTWSGRERSRDYGWRRSRLRGGRIRGRSRRHLDNTVHFEARGKYRSLQSERRWDWTTAVASARTTAEASEAP